MKIAILPTEHHTLCPIPAQDTEEKDVSLDGNKAFSLVDLEEFDDKAILASVMERDVKRACNILSASGAPPPSPCAVMHDSLMYSYL